MPPARIAIIGAGHIGRRHLGILLEDGAYQAVAIADPSPAAEALAKESGVPHFSNFARMLDDVKPDGVVIATPNQFHGETTLACVARRIPVLLEKPVADTLAEAAIIVEAAEHAGVPLLIGHHRRHHPILRRAAEALREGVVGRITAVACLWLHKKDDAYFDTAWRTRAGGGPVLINAIHDIDSLRMLCGEIESVQAATANEVRKFAVEDTAAAILRFTNGALGTLVVTDTSSSPWTWDYGARDSEEGKAPRDALFIAGTRASLAVPSLETFRHEPGRAWIDPLSQARMTYEPADAYKEQMRNFAAVIRGTEEPRVSGREGLLTLAATLAIHESAKTGQPVRLDEFIARQ